LGEPGGTASAEADRFATVVHELAEWLVVQLHHNRLLEVGVLLDRIRRHAVERDRRRNPSTSTFLPA
jgi:hypothetical protein